MKKLLIIVGVALAVAMYGMSVNNSMVRAINGLEVTVQDNEQKLSNVMMTIKEMSGVVKDSKAFQTEFTLEKMKARYGEEGLQGVMTWLQESSEPADLDGHEKLMDTIRSELASFKAAQTTLLDRLKTAKNMLTVTPKKQILSALGYKVDDIEKYRVILVSKEASDAFEKGSFDVEIKL